MHDPASLILLSFFRWIFKYRLAAGWLLSAILSGATMLALCRECEIAHFGTALNSSAISTLGLCFGLFGFVAQARGKDQLVTLCHLVALLTFGYLFTGFLIQSWTFCAICKIFWAVQFWLLSEQIASFSISGKLLGAFALLVIAASYGSASHHEIRTHLSSLFPEPFRLSKFETFIGRKLGLTVPDNTYLLASGCSPCVQARAERYLSLTKNNKEVKLLTPKKLQLAISEHKMIVEPRLLQLHPELNHLKTVFLIDVKNGIIISCK